MRRIILFFMAFLISVMSFPASFAANPVPKGTGVSMHFTGAPTRDLDLIKNAGLTYARTDLKWSAVEAQKGTYNWAQYDQLVSGLTSRGIRPYFILDYNNRAYGASSEMSGVSTQAQIDGYANFAKAAVARYKGKGVVWEIWNEPNLDIFWSPSPNPSNYMKLVKAAVPAMRSADPSAVIVAPAEAFMANVMTFMETCAQQGLFGLVDGVSIHAYDRAAPESGTIKNLYNDVRALITKYNPGNPNLPIIDSESGYSLTWSGITEAKQAQYVPRKIMYNQSLGLPISIIYSYKDDTTNTSDGNYYGWGLVRYDYSNRPAYTAVHTMLNALKGMNFNKRLSSASTDYLLEYTDGTRTTVAAWTTGTAHAVTIAGASKTISGTPIYVPVSGGSTSTPTTPTTDPTTPTTPTPTAGAPAAPSNLAIASVTKGSTAGNYYVNLKWTDNATNETGFKIYQSVNSTSNFQQIKTPAVNATGYGINIGATPSGTYYYKVTAVNSTGESQASNIINRQFGTSTASAVPAAPTNLTLTGVTKGSTSGNYYVNLKWTDNATNETGYQIYQSVNSTSNFQLIKTPAVNATGYGINVGATPTKGTYYYKVYAVNSAGKSQPSNTITARVYY